PRVLFLVTIPPSLTSLLFPYTTLFRSGLRAERRERVFGVRAVPQESPQDTPVGREVHEFHPNQFAQAGFQAAGMFQGRLDLGLRSEEHTSELQSLAYLVCRLLLEKKK